MGRMQIDVYPHITNAKAENFNTFRKTNMGQNSDRGISNFQSSDKSLINKNCHNLRTSNNIGIKPGSVTELDKENKTASKKLMVTSCWQILTSSFF